MHKMSNERAESAKQYAAQMKAYYNNMPKQPMDPMISAMQKADVPMSFSTTTSWFDPLYLGQLTLESLVRQKKMFSSLRKTTYAQEGDSYQVIGGDVAAASGPESILETATLYANTVTPTISDVDGIYPAVFHVDWTNTDVAQAMSALQRSRGTASLEDIRKYFSDLFLTRLDMQLCGVYNDFIAGGNGTNQGGYGVDSPATQSGAAQFECLDRIVTDNAEGTGGTYISAVTDGDIFWNSTGTAGTIRFNRVDASATGQGQVRLPTGGTAAAGEAYNILDELDDLMTKCLVYAGDNPDYVAYMSPKAYNKIKAESDPKALITDYTGSTQAVNGVTSTPGVTGGKVQLSALRLSDITVPIVTVNYLMGTSASGWLWKNSVHTTGGPGNIYLINQNSVEFRTLVPPTYRSVQAENALETKHTLWMSGQLIAKNWMSNGKLTSISS
jgi:hypothetical protein